MPEVLIAAIARTADDAELEKLLAQCSALDASRITLFRADHIREAPTRVRMHFVALAGAPVERSSGGADLPGIGTPLVLKPYVVDALSMDHLRGMGISSDAAHYYSIAMDDGRSVVTYVTGAESATSAEEQFRARGFVKIRRFPHHMNTAVA
jgi:hypothetical protein